MARKKQKPAAVQANKAVSPPAKSQPQGHPPQPAPPMIEKNRPASPTEEPVAEKHLWEFTWARDLLIIAVIAVVLLLVYMSRAILIPVLVGLVLAYIFNPVITWAHVRLKVPRVVAVSVLLASILIASLGLLLYFGPLAVNQATSLVNTTIRYTNKLAQEVPAAAELRDKLLKNFGINNGSFNLDDGKDDDKIHDGKIDDGQKDEAANDDTKTQPEQDQLTQTDMSQAGLTLPGDGIAAGTGTETGAGAVAEADAGKVAAEKTDNTKMVEAIIKVVDQAVDKAMPPASFPADVATDAATDTKQPQSDKTVAQSDLSQKTKTAQPETQPVADLTTQPSTQPATQPAGKGLTLGSEFFDTISSINWPAVFTLLLGSLNIGMSVVGYTFGVIGYSLLATALIAFCFFTFSVNLERVRETFASYVPTAYRQETFRIVGKMDATVAAIIRGRLIQAFALMIMLSFGWFLADVPYWLLLGVVAGALNLLPYAASVGLPAAILAVWINRASGGLPFDPLAIFVWPGLVYFIGQFVDGWIIEPWVQGKATNFSPLTVLLAVLIGASVAGLAGMLLAIPVAACLKIFYDEFVDPRLMAYLHQDAETD